MNIILLILLSSLWSILLLDFFEPFDKLRNKLGLGYKRTIMSDIKIIDAILYIIHKVINCSSCFSSHLFWISYLIINHSLFGLLLMPIVFFLTYIIKDKLLVVKF